MRHFRICLISAAERDDLFCFFLGNCTVFKVDASSEVERFRKKCMIVFSFCLLITSIFSCNLCTESFTCRNFFIKFTFAKVFAVVKRSQRRGAQFVDLVHRLQNRPDLANANELVLFLVAYASELQVC